MTPGPAYDITNDQGKVRLLISDVGGSSGTDFLFQDDEIQSFLDMRGGAVFSAAATALRAVAGNEAQVSKRIKFLELETDGPVVAKALMDLATSYEKQEDDDAMFDWAQLATTPAARRELREWPDLMTGDVI